MKLPRCAFFLLFFSIFIVACVAPGQGGKFSAGKKRGDAIVTALNAYHLKNGQYPVSLKQLGGQFAAIENGAGGDQLTFIYASNAGGGYTLVFKYFGPGSNLCVHESVDASGEWECSGSH
ncbi:hypothetical protein [Xanthomonas sp. 1678]|uniref:hypothetical protein n=1 Tax=Xanthomonas sp. 1678 TaxID=3158788 RepID=UPI002862E344|nr:hypothetical protein [Xanthomonas translucens]